MLNRIKMRKTQSAICNLQSEIALGRNLVLALVDPIPTSAPWTNQQWSALIKNALLWREAWRDEAVDHAATFPDTLRFVQFVLDQIVAKSD
jgi:hypothetical protein